MKRLHRADLWGWSVFNPERNIDFHSTLWQRPAGNIAFDPLPQSEHDRQHLLSLGPLAFIVITNSDHVRDAVALAEATGAKLAGPRGEQGEFPVRCDRWLAEGDQLVEDLEIVTFEGSKTPGELACIIAGHTLITGDLLRAHQAAQLMLLPDAKLSNKPRAIADVKRRLGSRELEAVLVGDGWPIFRDGQRALRELIATLDA
jgi:glyoxylase-like metal-dependent hydrolase (beta-lactamase superfamily II)